MKIATFKAENSDEIVWLLLNRLKSAKLCETLIREKCNDNSVEFPDNIIEAKAVGLSSAIESALGYWQTQPRQLNAKVLSRYYFLLQMTIAEQVGGIDSPDDLASIQKHTEFGHGLGTIADSENAFPHNYNCYVIRNGHFYSYLKYLGLPIGHFGYEKRPKNYKDIVDKSRTVRLVDLFRRIPELNTVIEEYLNEPPLAFHIAYSPSDNQHELDLAKVPIERTGQFAHAAPITSSEKISYIVFYPTSKRITPEYLQQHCPFLQEFKLDPGRNNEEPYITAKLIHPSNSYWYDIIPTYRSAHSPQTYIVPLWNTTSDLILINFILLYALSIIVRYLPDLWYRISSGNLNHLHSLIEYYVSIMDHVLPLQLLERVTGKSIQIHQPGSIFGPI